MLYKQYENKITKIAKKLAFVKRHKIPILSTLGLMLSVLFTFLGVSGIIQEDLQLSKETYTYGETIAYEKASSFISKTHYEYAIDSDNASWTSIVPTTAGDYKVRAYTYNGYHIKRYGKEKKFRIEPKDVKLTISSSYITYGETPAIGYGNNLVGSDKIDQVKINVGNLFSQSTTATIDLSSIRIVNDAGIDVTSSYNFETESKTVSIRKRTIVLKSNTVSSQYDGNSISSSNVTFSYGSLADGDYFQVNPTATGSTVFAQTTNTISPSVDKLKIYNPTYGDVTSLYNISYDEGYLSATIRSITVTGPSYSTTYNSSYQSLPTTSSSLLNGIKASGLASGDRITETWIYSPNLLTGSEDIDFGFDIVNSSGESVLSYYKVNKVLGKFTIAKKDLHVSLSVRNNGSSQVSSTTGNYGNISEIYTKDYDGSYIYGEVNQTSSTNSDLCYGDTLFASRVSYRDVGTYEPDLTFTVNSRDNTNVTDGYNIIYNKARIVINKRTLKVEVEDLNLFINSTLLSSNLVSYSITSGSLASNDSISFIPKSNKRDISNVKEGTYDLFEYFDLNLSNSRNYNDVVVTNSPKIKFTKANFNLVLSSKSVTYSGTSQRFYARRNDGFTIRSDSTIPSNISYGTFFISKYLTDVEKYYLSKDDITFSASYSHSASQNGSRISTTLTLAKDNVNISLYDNNNSSTYFEVTKKVYKIKFKPPVKYFDNKVFDPNVLIENSSYYEVESGSLVSGHSLSFEIVNGISSVGTYFSDTLVNSYKLKILDRYNNDQTSNYDLSYSFDDLVIIKADVAITLKDYSSSLSSSQRTYGDLFYKTYNGEETSTFSTSSNDYNLSQYSSSYTISDNIGANYSTSNYSISATLGIDSATDAGSYDIKIKSFSITIDDVYSTNITSSSYADVYITNGNSGYEIKKKNISLNISNLTYIWDGNNVDYNYELDVNYSSSLISGHQLYITGNSISDVGTYTSDDLDLKFTILDSDGKDVTNNYELTWANKSSFTLSVQKLRVYLTRAASFADYSRTYDGTPINEEDLYTSLIPTNANNDSKHTYNISIELKDNIPDSYYDAGTYSFNSPSMYSTIYCTKEYNGKSVKFEVTEVNYEVSSNFPVITSKRDLSITINDIAYWLGEDEYTFDYSAKSSQVTISGLASGDKVQDISIQSGNGISYSVGGNSYDVADYASYFNVSIYNSSRGKDVTNNYNISYSGTITYKKASINLTPISSEVSYDGKAKTIGSCLATSDLPSGATYEVIYDYNLSDGTSVSKAKHEEKKVGTTTYSINSVNIIYNGKNISEYCDINYSTSDATYTISKASVTFDTGNFSLGLGFLYNFEKPSASSASMGVNEFNKSFKIVFDNLVDDPNGLFEVDENGYVRPLIEGTTDNQVRGVTIYDLDGNDVTEYFDISWIIGKIKIGDISI